MPLFKLKQIQEESDSWKRYLAFVVEENIYLKDRLSQAVKNSLERTALEDMENFFNRSLHQDEVLALIRHDVAEFDKLLMREKYEDGVIVKKVNNELNKNRANIRKFSEAFDNFKSEFNNYLLENIE